mmetsp:Transcript_6598/g.10078  ORF Transcript_6598/g.10078 Transcript_6598/m.10078 type:complete len:262 (+) Transcript_6598:985-1770(+)
MNKCGRCKGDCDSDSDCAGNLKCFQRDDDTAIPGCNGNGATTYDYCYDPADFGPSSSPVLVPVPSITPSTPSTPRPSLQGSTTFTMPSTPTPTTTPVTPQEACYVCGEGNEVGNPGAVVWGMTCHELQLGGELGLLPDLPCFVYSTMATLHCGCRALAPIAPVAPISAAPVTPAPVTPAPVTPVTPVTSAPVGSAPNAERESSCRDFGNTFEVDNAVGSRDCGWLRENFDRFSYLCRFVDVAYECRTLCDTCSYFEPRTLT